MNHFTLHRSQFQNREKEPAGIAVLVIDCDLSRQNGKQTLLATGRIQEVPIIWAGLRIKSLMAGRGEKSD